MGRFSFLNPKHPFPTMKYTGTKTVEASPMTRGVYNEYRGWTLPLNENPDDQGYLVEYTDGGKANDSRHAGYISWSPKDVFERSYKPVIDPRFAIPHQERVFQELLELNTKIEALVVFLTTETFKALDTQERGRLLRQVCHMKAYALVLDERVAAF